MEGVYSQSESKIGCEWGPVGMRRLLPEADVVIVVDVLSFTTCVEIALSRGAIIFPFPTHDDAARQFAEAHHAVLASRDRTARYSLSPRQLLSIEPNTRLVLPSPNGSALSAAGGDTTLLAGCLRNARAVADYAQSLGRRIAVVPAGERWRPEDTLRPALEDWVGAGAIISILSGNKSPEAQAAQHTFELFRDDLPALLRSIASGKELIERGFAEDVALAAALDVSAVVPLLVDGAYQKIG